MCCWCEVTENDITNFNVEAFRSIDKMFDNRNQNLENYAISTRKNKATTDFHGQEENLYLKSTCVK